MVSINIHNVKKIEVGEINEFVSENKLFYCRELIITDEKTGYKFRIDLYNDVRDKLLIEGDDEQ